MWMRIPCARSFSGSRVRFAARHHHRLANVSFSAARPCHVLEVRRSLSMWGSIKNWWSSEPTPTAPGEAERRPVAFDPKEGFVFSLFLLLPCLDRLETHLAATPFDEDTKTLIKSASLLAMSPNKRQTPHGFNQIIAAHRKALETLRHALGKSMHSSKNEQQTEQTTAALHEAERLTKEMYELFVNSSTDAKREIPDLEGFKKGIDYGAMMDLLTLFPQNEANPARALRTFQFYLHSGQIVSTGPIDSLIRGLVLSQAAGKGNFHEHVRRVWNAMKKLEVRPTSMTLSYLLQNAETASEARKLWNELAVHGNIQPNAVSLDGLFVLVF